MANHYLTFDGVSTNSYDIYISEEGVFNAPERDVEMITIPGRNGEYALDKGRFNNITVTYPAFNYETTMANFTSKLSNLRNALASRVGYKWLTDTLHTDEYRMAVFKGGLEIDPIKYNTASQFDIVFECKPQRFLTSGETATTVSNNGTLTNPTLFPSSPLLQVTGYGTINLGSESLTVNNQVIGDIVVADVSNKSNVSTISLDTTYANSGDAIRLSATLISHLYADYNITSITPGTVTGNGTASGTFSGRGAQTYLETGEIIFNYGTSRTESNSLTFTIEEIGHSTTQSVSFSVAYNGSNSITLTASGSVGQYIRLSAQYKKAGQVILNSSKNTGATYIDLEIGEAYKLNNNVMTSANNIVSLPPELPTLKPGTTTITYPNTVTQLKVTPRWWKI